MRRRAMRLALFGVILLVPWAAAQDDPLYMIHVQEYEFLPTVLSVPAGATVYGMNFGAEAHTITSADGLFDLQALQPEESQQFVAPFTPGNYPYSCRYHDTQGMSGTLVVSRDAAPSSGSPPASAAGGEKDSPAPWFALIVVSGAAIALLRRPRTR